MEFLNVRHQHVLDVPERATEYNQIFGRCVRVNSHRALRPEERNVKFYLHSASMPTHSKTDRARIAALSRTAKWRDRLAEGLRLWNSEAKAPKGVRGIVEGRYAPKKTVDVEKLAILSEDLKSTQTALDSIRSCAIDVGLY